MPPAQAATAAQIHEAAAVLLRDPGFQTTLPGPSQASALDLTFLGPALTLVLWAMLAGAVGLVGYVLYRRLHSRVAEVALAPGSGVEGAGRPAPAHLADAERLASAGQFADALHALLLAAFAELARVSPLPTALTSREVLRHAALPSGPRAALAPLVTAVELARFGGGRVEAADFQLARERYRAFAEGRPFAPGPEQAR